MADDVVIRVKRKQLSGQGLTQSLESGHAYRIMVCDPEIEFLEVGDTLIRFNSAVLLPGETAPSADGESRPGLDVIRACLQYAKTRTGKTILVAGHTDTSGSDEYNVTLSRLRAEAVHGMLAGDRQQFAHACFGPHLTAEQRYPDGGSGKKKGVLWDDYQDILNWAQTTFVWPCGYPTGNPTLWNATVKFQKSYNLSDLRGSNPKIGENGTFNEETWGAVYDCYCRDLMTKLGTDEQGLETAREQVVYFDSAQHLVACGESKPIDEVGRNNYRSQTNRRVEVMFLDPDEKPAIPCLDSGTCASAGCELFDTAKFKRKNLPLDPSAPFPAGTNLVRVRLHDHAGKLMPETFYRYRFPGDAQWSDAYQADADGWAQVPEPSVCPATIEVEWETLGSLAGQDVYLYSRELHIDCGASEIDDATATTSDAVATQRLHDLGYDEKDMTYAEAESAFRSDYKLASNQDTKAELNKIFKDKDCVATRPV